MFEFPCKNFQRCCLCHAFQWEKHSMSPMYSISLSKWHYPILLLITLFCYTVVKILCMWFLSDLLFLVIRWRD